MWREIVWLGDQTSFSDLQSDAWRPLLRAAIVSDSSGPSFPSVRPAQKNMFYSTILAGAKDGSGRNRYLASYYLRKLRPIRRTINFSLETPSGNREESQRNS